MWHERRPTQPLPSPRVNSPVPRRPTLSTPPPRPGLYPRSSSLVTTPSGSTTSLSSTLRAANGSALRHELRNEPPVNVPDPLQVLESIIGAPPRKTVHDGDLSPKSEEALREDDWDIDFKGRSLQAFADESVRNGRSSNVNNSSLQRAEYNKEKVKFEDLHQSITACDQVLKSVETYLTGFQADLGAVSSEIETLQTRSTTLNTKLENRRVVEKLLGPAVEDLSLSPEIIRKIAEGPIDDGWIRALAELEKRSKAVDARVKEQKRLQALEDLVPLLESLTNKAVERIRDYLVAQIKALRSPNMNAQIIQQQGFLKFKDLYTFLFKHQAKLAGEISQAYVNTMRWYYLSQFTRYDAALKQIKLHVLDKQDLIGSVDDPSNRRTARGAPASHDAFSIGRRMDIIKNPSPDALTSYLAEEDKTSHYLEFVFRSFNLTLMDNATFEYTFLTNFFSPAQNFHAITRTFEAIFSPTFKLGQELTRFLVESSTDALGILLCVRLNQRFAFDFQRRKVPPGEGYINATSMLLWPRFQLLMDMHCESLRKRQSSPGQSTAPHPVTQRFASFLQGILALSSEAGDDEPVANSLSRLRSDYEALITRLSKGMADSRKRERFLFNNYSLVGTILEDANGRLAEENRKHFQELRKAYGDELK